MTAVSEEAQEIIDDLRNDLRIKEQEFEELKAEFERIQKEN